MTERMQENKKTVYEESKLLDEILEKTQRIDSIVLECIPIAASQSAEISKALLLAKGVNRLMELFDTKEIMENIMALANTKLGFMTDKSPAIIRAAKYKNKTINPYSYSEIKPCIIEALLNGYRITGNEINIISGNMYPAKDGKYRKIVEYPGVTDFAFTTTTPEYISETRMNYGSEQTQQFAKVGCFASWKKNGKVFEVGNPGKDGSIEDRLVFKIKAYGNDDDNVLGKSLSKLFTRVLMRITGKSESEMTEFPGESIMVDQPSVETKPTNDLSDAINSKKEQITPNTDKKQEKTVEKEPETDKKQGEVLNISEWLPNAYKNMRAGKFDILDTADKWTGFARYIFDNRGSWKLVTNALKETAKKKWEILYKGLPFILDDDGNLLAIKPEVKEQTVSENFVDDIQTTDPPDIEGTVSVQDVLDARNVVAKGKVQYPEIFDAVTTELVSSQTIRHAQISSLTYNECDAILEEMSKKI